MTREEAIKAAREGAKSSYIDGARTLVDALAALGLLRFDAPGAKRPLDEHVFAARLASHLYAGNQGGPIVFPATVMKALEASGLELVEKK